MKIQLTLENDAQVTVKITPFSNGLDSALSFNGVHLRSIYENETILDSISELILARYRQRIVNAVLV